MPLLQEILRNNPPKRGRVRSPPDLVPAPPDRPAVALSKLDPSRGGVRGQGRASRNRFRRPGIGVGRPLREPGGFHGRQRRERDQGRDSRPAERIARKIRAEGYVPIPRRIRQKENRGGVEESGMRRHPADEGHLQVRPDRGRARQPHRVPGRGRAEGGQLGVDRAAMGVIRRCEGRLGGLTSSLGTEVRMNHQNFKCRNKIHNLS